MLRRTADLSCRDSQLKMLRLLTTNGNSLLQHRVLCCSLTTVSPKQPCISMYCSKHSLDLCLQLDKMVAFCIFGCTLLHTTIIRFDAETIER